MSVFLFLRQPSKALAFDTSSANFINGGYYNNLISDDAFIAKDSMSANEIQQFLSSKGSYLAGYSEGGRSAAQIIWDASQGNSFDSRSNGWKPIGHPDFPDINQTTGTVSPRVILVTLQKEQSLITGGYSNVNYALTHAMGYGCPDSGGCDPNYLTFTKQIDWGAWVLRYAWYRAQGYGFSDDQVGQTENLSDYTGSYNVTYTNRATASLYRYTPHVFNGNYNFWKLYKSYFESQLVLNVGAGGNVNVYGAGLFNACSGASCRFSYSEGVSLTLAVSDNPAAEFIGWSGGCTGMSTTCTLTMSDGFSTTANFAQSLDTPNTSFASGPNNWSVNNSRKLVSGDFNGDSNKDVAVMYDYSQNNMGLLVFPGNGFGGFLSPQTWFITGPNNWSVNNTREMIAGDFDNDGNDDLLFMYDYGQGNMGLLVVHSNGSVFNSISTGFSSGLYNWFVDSSRKIVSGDFNDDNNKDVTIMYDYGQNNMGLLVFLGNGSGGFLSPQTWFITGPNNWSVNNTREMIAGDFDSNGNDDLLFMYDYGQNNMGLLVVHSNSSSFNTISTGFGSGPNNWSVNSSRKIVSGDFNGDESKDVTIMYDYGQNNVAFFVFRNNGDANFLSPQCWYSSGPNNWSVNSTREMIANDFDNDGYDDLLFMYDYGQNNMALLIASKSGYAFSK